MLVTLVKTSSTIFFHPQKMDPTSKIPKKPLHEGFNDFEFNPFTFENFPRQIIKHKIVKPKIYECDKCKKKCSSYTVLKKHSIEVHKRPCPIQGCKKKLWRRAGNQNSLESDMAKHFRAVHPNEPIPSF